jgi:hypothetical protein
LLADYLQPPCKFTYRALPAEFEHFEQAAEAADRLQATLQHKLSKNKQICRHA